MLAAEYFALLQRRELQLLVDDPALSAPLRERGFTTAPFLQDALAGPDAAPALVVSRTREGASRLQTLWDRATAPFSHLELARFDDSLDNTLYAFDLLLSFEVDEALRRRAQAHALLLGGSGLVVEAGAGSLEVELGEELELVNDEDALEPGWVHAVAEWLEAAVVNIASERSSVAVEGELPFDGLVSVCNSPELRGRWGALLAELAETSARGGGWVCFEDNRVTRLYIGGEDRSDALRALTEGRERGAALTEFAVGCAPTSQSLRWSHNAVLNKVVPGVHLGVGMALDIPHLAFISSGARVRVAP